MLSPWLHELQRIRPITILHADTKTDVAIVGAGIAGVTTAYFILKYTSLNVLLVEASKVAHGATGHNAGQLTSYFERPFSDLVKEFGLPLAAEGQKAIDSAWLLIDEIMQDTQLTTPLFRVTGYAGLSTAQNIIEHLHNNALKIEAGIAAERMFIAEEWDRSTIPSAYAHVYEVLPQADILEMLETSDTQYIAALQGQKGCMNSARFCEELVGFMLERYQGRFTLAEHTPVHTVVLGKDQQQLRTENYTILASHIVLCTNGFEQFSIEHEEGKNINSHFHAMVEGTIGHMTAYTERLNSDPTAKSYFPSTHLANSKETEPEPYYYMTRRPFEIEKNLRHNLICVGGPEEALPDTKHYSTDIPNTEEVAENIKTFLSRTLPERKSPEHFVYRWHGLMGYTPNNIRRVGPEPEHPYLLYNLGCNGVGILPSVFGARRITRYLNNENVEPSIFDIPKQ